MPRFLLCPPRLYGRVARGICLTLAGPAAFSACDGRVRPTEAAPAAHLAAGITGVVADTLDSTPALRFACVGGVPSSFLATADAPGLALEFELDLPLVAGSTDPLGASLRVEASHEAGPRIFGLTVGPTAPASSVILAPAGRHGFEVVFDLQLVDMTASNSESAQRVRVQGRLVGGAVTSCDGG